MTFIDRENLGECDSKGCVNVAEYWGRGIFNSNRFCRKCYSILYHQRIGKKSERIKY